MMKLFFSTILVIIQLSSIIGQDSLFSFSGWLKESHYSFRTIDFEFEKTTQIDSVNYHLYSYNEDMFTSYLFIDGKDKKFYYCAYFNGGQHFATGTFKGKRKKIVLFQNNELTISSCNDAAIYKCFDFIGRPEPVKINRVKFKITGNVPNGNVPNST
jgi:hypothetical protein